jgi:hypothetical protein
LSNVLLAKPVSRAAGKKQLFGFLVVTDDTVIHVSPKHQYLKILMIGFLPYLLLGGNKARKNAATWLANPPDNSDVIPLDSITAVKRGRIKLNKKAPAIVTSDGREHVFGMQYKALQPTLASSLTGKPGVTIEPL